MKSVILTEDMVDAMNIDYSSFKKATHLIIDKDYCSDPIWDGVSGANDCLAAYKGIIPDYLYDELDDYSRVWEIMSNTNLHIMTDESLSDEKIEELLNQKFSVDFPAWEKSLAERLSVVCPSINWGWKEYVDGKYVTCFINKDK